MDALIITREPSFLADLHCGCGSKAEIAWYLPVPKEKPKKLSKTEEAERPEGERKPHPYGRACMSHLPAVDRVFLARLEAFV